MARYEGLEACLLPFGYVQIVLPVLRDANTEQARVGEEHVGGQRRIVRIEERAGDRALVEHVLGVDLRLPAILVGEDQRQVHIGITMKLVIGLVVEDTGEGISLPVEIAAKCSCPGLADWHRVLRTRRQRERWRVGKLVAAQILGETFAIVRRQARVEAGNPKCAQIGTAAQESLLRAIGNIACNDQRTKRGRTRRILWIVLNELANDRGWQNAVRG